MKNDKSERRLDGTNQPINVADRLKAYLDYFDIPDTLKSSWIDQILEQSTSMSAAFDLLSTLMVSDKKCLGMDVRLLLVNSLIGRHCLENIFEIKSLLDVPPITRSSMTPEL